MAKRPRAQPSISKEQVNEFEIEKYSLDPHTTLRAFKSVQLESGDYLRIHKITNRVVCRDSEDFIKSDIFLTGALFTRATTLRFLYNKGNEVAMVDGETRVNVKEVQGKRRLIITNAPFPEYRREGLLVCRWVWVVDDEKKDEGLIRRISEAEADKEYKWDNVVLRTQWRGERLEELKAEDERNKQAALEKSRWRKEEIKAKRGYTVDLTEDSFFGGEERSSLCNQTSNVTEVDGKYYTGRKKHGNPEEELGITAISSTTPQAARKPESRLSDDNSPIVIVDEEEEEMPLLRLQREDTFTNFRTGQTIRASHIMQLHEIKANIPLEAKEPELEPPKYTFGDAFCGVGGMSRAADMAGLFVKWGVDKDEAAIQAYQLNFPTASSYHSTVDELLLNLKKSILVDVLHLSPPCQPYSPAHTRDGKNDELNEAALFSIDKFLEVSRPRYATVEQTYGIIHHELLPGLLSPFLDRGFSVKYKVLHGAEYGVPQTRRRLIVLAAGSVTYIFYYKVVTDTFLRPGETLPSFPKPTHYLISPNSKLLPPTTIHDIISKIPINSTDHEFRYFPSQKPPSDPHRQCKTLMAGGSDAEYHPSGLRPYTIREKACLQTFPGEHIFYGPQTQKQKQIGNAVPPILGKAVLSEVVKALVRADKIEEMRRNQATRRGVVRSGEQPQQQEDDAFLEILD